MGDYNNALQVRIKNQSMQLVKAIVRVVNGINEKSLSSQMIIAGESEYICIPQNQNLQDTTIYLYTANTATGQWGEFAVVPVSSLDVNLLWVTEANGVVILTQYGCSNTNDLSGQMYYIQLHHYIAAVMRIYVSYYVDGKFYSKKMSNVYAGKTKKVWVPIEARSLTVKVQDWLFGWEDAMIYYIPAITDNRCYEAYVDEGGDIRAKPVECK